MIHVAVGCYDGSIHGWSLNENSFENETNVGKSSDKVETSETSETLETSDILEEREMKFHLDYAYAAHRKSVRCLRMKYFKNHRNSSQILMASGGADESLMIYDVLGLKEMSELRVHEDTVLSIAWIGTKFLLSGSNDGKLLLWRTRDWALLHDLKGHKDGPVTSISPHPSGKLALTTSNDNSLRMWNLTTGRPAARRKLSGKKKLSHVTWDPNGRFYVLLVDDLDILVFDSLETPENGNKKRKISNKEEEDENEIEKEKMGYVVKIVHDRRVNSIVFIEDVVFAAGSDDGLVRILGIDGSFLRLIDCAGLIGKALTRRIRDLAPVQFHNESYLFTAGSDGVIQLWKVDVNVKEEEEEEEEEDKPIVELNVGSRSHITCLSAVYHE